MPKVYYNLYGYRKYHKPGSYYTNPSRSKACAFGEHSKCKGYSAGSDVPHSCGCHCHKYGVRHVVHKKGKKGQGRVFDYITDARAFKGIWR